MTAGLAGGRVVHPAAKTPCRDCPWRLANQGKRHPDGWYTKTNLRRLWTRLRDGDPMTCHPTDPENPVPEGWRSAPVDAKTRECAGALILQQREFMRWQDDCFGNLKVYRRLHVRGLTIEGIWAIASRAVLHNVPILGVGGPEMSKPNLNDAEVGYEPLGAWETRRD